MIEKADEMLGIMEQGKYKTVNVNIKICSVLAHLNTADLASS